MSLSFHTCAILIHLSHTLCNIHNEHCLYVSHLDITDIDTALAPVAGNVERVVCSVKMLTYVLTRSLNVKD
jgi:hypothetical protein